MDLLETIDIEAPAQAVWTLLTDTAQVQRWNPDMVSCEPLSPGGLRVGLRSRLRLREGGRVGEYEEEITALEPPRRIEMELRGASLGANPMRNSYELTPRGKGIRLVFRSSWSPSGLVLRVLAPMFAFMGRRNFRAAMQRLRALAEAGEGSRPVAGGRAPVDATGS